MYKHLNMTAFHEILTAESVKGQLIKALRSLLEIGEPGAVSQLARPQPLGVWSGWQM